MLAVGTYTPWNKQTYFGYYAKDIGLIQRGDGSGKQVMEGACKVGTFLI
ncbi:acetyltransferase [Sporosarcina newyorkensis 2681]|uniref:Acetyltransferase n=1 Tax=Sporosarcina newyorkensis 2681 TaxID=1027292 RepID=F9DT17_9BACL|nr:acetyltransferase [Sporosarcina newyorkensis 2681]